MTGILPTVFSRLLVHSVQLLTPSVPLRTPYVPLRLAALPPRLAALLLPVALPLLAALSLAVAGCAEPAQDVRTASQQASEAQAPAISTVTDAPQVPVMSAAPAAPSIEPVYLTSETTASMNLPFSDAVRVGNLLFLSGQIGMLPGTKNLAPGGIQGEARQTMENIRTVLEANGSSMDRVFKATVMLADIAEWPAFNEVYVTYFPGDKPARSAFAGSGLAFGARCEVEVIATVGE